MVNSVSFKQNNAHRYHLAASSPTPKAAIIHPSLTVDKYEFSKKNFYDVEPEKAISWDFKTSVENLSKIIGKDATRAILKGKNIKSPVSECNNGDWIKESKIIGINPRAIGNYWNIAKYAMTFPEDSIHLLPLFEQGCSGSLYSPLNWKLSDEFMDKDLISIGFDTPEKQLKLVNNVLHAMGKTVGMDFLQHTDRFSEEVFINPECFEWIKLDDSKSRELFFPEVEPDLISEEVKDVIKSFIKINGNAQGEKASPILIENLFGEKISNQKRGEILLGNGNVNERNKRRLELMNAVRKAGYETKPVHIESPLIPVYFDKIHHNDTTDWAVFKDNRSNKIFGNLTAFKLYHTDRYGNIDKTRPNTKAWDYICNHIKDFQNEYGFDFLRADMGYLDYLDDNRDLHASIKKSVQDNGAKYFASFGECFSPECMDNPWILDKKNYDAVLGNLHYKEVLNNDFLDTVKRYNFNPNYKISVTSITADSDQAVYNNLYDKLSNQIRVFLGLFLNQPSYTGMGIETRDINPTDGKNLTKDFINDWGIPKYEWGKNKNFFKIISEMRNLYSNIRKTIHNQLHYWLYTSDNSVASWFYYDKKSKMPSYLFVVNADEHTKPQTKVQNIFDTNIFENQSASVDKLPLKEIYSTQKPKKLEGRIIAKGQEIKITNLAPGECRIYKVIKNSKACNNN